MVDLFLDVRRGATVEAVLGALIEAGASLETVDAAVAALGRGDVRLQVQAGTAGSAVRIRAPEGAPTHETWQDLRPRIALLAVDEAVVSRALTLLDALFAARAQVHGVAPEDVDVVLGSRRPRQRGRAGRGPALAGGGAAAGDCGRPRHRHDADDRR